MVLNKCETWMAEYWIYSSIEPIVCSDLTEQNDNKPLTCKHIQLMSLLTVTCIRQKAVRD